MNLQFDAVLHRTDRRELPEGCIRRELEERVLTVSGLRAGEWSDSLDESDLRDAWVHVDVLSSFLTNRQSAPDALGATGDEWNGIRMELPEAMVGGDYHVRLQVTVAWHADHARAGLILARSPELVLIEGPVRDGGRASLLPVRPSDEVRGLHELLIDEQEGPVLLVNSEIQGSPWRKIATEPHFQLACLESCFRSVFTHLALSQEGLPSWADRWMQVPGAKGRDLPSLPEGEALEVYNAAHEWAIEVARSCCSAMELVDRFRDQAGIEDDM